MKTIKAFLMAMMIIHFGSCKEDNPSPNSNADFVGSWKQVSKVSSNCTDTSRNENYTCTSACVELVFTATTISIDGHLSNYATSGNRLTITSTASSFTASLIFSLNGTTLTLTAQDSLADGDCTTVSTYQRI